MVCCNRGSNGKMSLSRIKQRPTTRLGPVVWKELKPKKRIIYTCIYIYMYYIYTLNNWRKVCSLNYNFSFLGDGNMTTVWPLRVTSWKSKTDAGGGQPTAAFQGLTMAVMDRCQWFQLSGDARRDEKLQRPFYLKYRWVLEDLSNTRWWFQLKNHPNLGKCSNLTNMFQIGETTNENLGVFFQWDIC